MVLDGVCRYDANGSSTFIEADAPTDDTLQEELSMIPGEQARASRHAIGHKSEDSSLSPMSLLPLR